MVILCLVGLIQSGQPFPVSADPGPIRKWLHSLVIHIPDLTINVTEHISIGIDNLTCSNTTLDEISSSYTPPATAAFGVEGVGIECVGLYWLNDTSLGKFGYEKGQAFVTIGNESSLSAGIELRQGPDGLADQSVALPCKLDLRISNLTLSGRGIVAKIIDAFEGLIKTALDIELDTVVCKALKELINVQLNATIADLNDFIRPYLKPKPIPKPWPAPPGSISFIDNSLVSLIDYFIDDLLGDNIDLVGHR